MKMVRVVAPHFVAGFESDGTTVVRAAPIIKYLIGKTEAYARHYLKQKGWTACVVKEREHPERAEIALHACKR
jgi:hypothetical protein